MLTLIEHLSRTTTRLVNHCISIAIPYFGKLLKDSSRYRPQLLGRLPDDFLRLPQQMTLENDSIDHLYDDIDAHRSRSLKHHQHNRYSAPPPHMSHTYLGVIRYCITWAVWIASYVAYHLVRSTPTSKSKPLHHHHQQGWGEQRERQHVHDVAAQAAALKEKMVENEFQRRSTADPELAQFLDDERIALMLQNKEFIRSLRNDKHFMQILARGILPLCIAHYLIRPSCR